MRHEMKFLKFFLYLILISINFSTLVKMKKFRLFQQIFFRLWNALIVITKRFHFISDDTKMLIDGNVWIPYVCLEYASLKLIKQLSSLLILIRCYPNSLNFLIFYVCRVCIMIRANKKSLEFWSMKLTENNCVSVFGEHHACGSSQFNVPTALQTYYFIQLSY
jgi:hypothetical protein